MTLTIIAIVTLLFLMLLSTVEYSLESYSVIRFQLDKKEEMRYAMVMEQLLERERELFGSFRVFYSLLLILFAITAALLSPKLITGFVAALFALLFFTRLIPTLIARFAANWILSKFIYLAKGVLLLFSPFVPKRDVIPPPIEKEESSEITILQNAINFSEVKVKECMVPRTEIWAAPEEVEHRQLMELFVESGFSRVPIYRESLDTIIGYIHSKDLFSGERSVKEIMRPIHHISEEAEAQELLPRMIKSKRSIAVVNDEYGGTAGIVTLEDLIEEIFGEISDELDREELVEEKISESQFLFSGRLEVKYLNKSYDLELPESEEYETLSGFITWFNEDIPEEGETLYYEDYSFTVEEVDSNRIESVTLRIVV